MLTLPRGARRLKSARHQTHADGGTEVSARVAQLLGRVDAAEPERMEREILRLSREFDGGPADPVVSEEMKRQARAMLDPALAAHIRFAHDNIRRFADMQRAALIDCEMEVIPGLIAGQRQIPVDCAGCYVPGGRYVHIASALMTVTTARAAGVGKIVAATPPRQGGLHPAVTYALDIAGADRILALGGVQAVAALAHGAFGGRPADVIAGPGNALVAEAKRQLYGEVGIDMVAGPTDSLVIADRSAHPAWVAADLVGQAEHGATSPVWLVTDDADLAREIAVAVAHAIASLPEPNRVAAAAAWEDWAEIILCDGRETMAQVADLYAPEHLHVQAGDLDWWLGRLRCYGSLFLGEEVTVPFGDKVSGPNHVLPTARAARYTGGLSVQKFLRTVTWQRADRRAADRLALSAAALSRAEGMEGHARSAELRCTPPALRTA
ncbi:histidinol dehydrogenase [Pseudogemmobacter sonorensis]|uniref:histidinol dehydrogenase n=1 Tax=Pseudogemmobacter sonorensis TaxID=2989681 RepID=UPI00368C0BD7